LLIEVEHRTDGADEAAELLEAVADVDPPTADTEDRLTRPDAGA
jgi:hypothetical protein